MKERYDCPHCGATDSGSGCPFMSPSDYDQRGWPRARATEAREVGCRVMFYHDRDKEPS